MLKRWGLVDSPSAQDARPQQQQQPIPSQIQAGDLSGQASGSSLPAGPGAAVAALRSLSGGAAASGTMSPQPGPSTPTRTMSASSTSSEVVPLKRVQFTVSNMCVTYPISNIYTPGSEDATRRRIEREHRQKLRERKRKRWTLKELEQLYRECCRTREELPLKKMRFVFQEAAALQESKVQDGTAAPGGVTLKTLDLSFLPLDRAAIDPLADFLSIDFGLSKLVLENCGLTDDVSCKVTHYSSGGFSYILHATHFAGPQSNPPRPLDLRHTTLAQSGSKQEAQIQWLAIRVWLYAASASFKIPRPIREQHQQALFGIVARKLGQAARRATPARGFRRAQWAVEEREIDRGHSRSG